MKTQAQSLIELFKLFFPMRAWWKITTAETVRHDFWAGITGLVLILPQGIAFALIAGLPPEFGLYSAIICAVIAGLFGSSWHLVTGPTVALSIVIPELLKGYAAIGSPQYIGLSLTLMFLVGLIQLAFGIFRLGGLVNFISHTVIIGFTAGAGVLIMISQLPAYLGIYLPRGLQFDEKLPRLWHHLGEAHGLTIAIASVTFATAIIIRRHNRRAPHMLLGILAGALLCYLLDGKTRGVAMLGELPSAMPQMTLPHLSINTITNLLPAALALALLGLIEAVSIARAIALRSHQRIDGNQEFFGQGLANLVGSCFSCYVASGSFNRSGINFDSGARTPLALVVTAVAVVLVLIFAPTITRFLPLPAIAGAIMLAGMNLFDFKHIRLIMQTSHQETAVIVATFLATLFLNLEFAIYVGVILSLVLYLQKIAHPKLTLVDFSPLYERDAGAAKIRVLRLDGSLFFGSIDHVQNRLATLRGKDQWRYVVILAEGLNRIDVAGLEMLTAERSKLLERDGDLFIIGMKPFVRDEIMPSPYWQRLGGETHLFSSTYIAFRDICLQVGITHYRRYMKHLFRDYNRLLSR